MRKLFLFLIPIVFLSCNLNTGTQGWYIDNKSNQDIEVYFDGIPYTVNGLSTTYLHDIPTKANISIADSYHVNYEVSYQYSTSHQNAKKLLIEDKAKFNYVIKNNTSVEITFDFKGETKVISAGSELQLTCYDKAATFTFTVNDITYNSTITLEDGIYYVEITE